MGLGDTIIGVIAGAFANRVQVKMVLEIGADAGQIVNDRHAHVSERVRGAYA